MNWNKCGVKPGEDIRLSEICTSAGIKKRDKKDLKAKLLSDI